MFTGATAAYQVAAAVLAGVQDQLTTTSDGAPIRAGVLNGAVAWDDCETCGQLAVAPVRLYLSDDFPMETPRGEYSGKVGLLVAEFVAQVIRCAPVMGETGTPPPVAALDRSAQVVLADAWSLLVGVSCTLDDLAGDSIVDYALRPVAFVGPEGGCVGSELGFAVSLDRR